MALAAIKGDRTLAELAEQFDVQAYLRAYGSVSKARTSRGRYLDFYNGCRPHSTLDRTSSLLHPAARPHGSLTMAAASLIHAEKLFRQPGATS